MTLQEKIDLLPMRIKDNGETWELGIIVLPYGETAVSYLETKRYDPRLRYSACDSKLPLSQRLEEVVDKALKAIKNKEWEK